MADANTPPSSDASSPGASSSGDSGGFTLDLSTGKAPTRRRRKRKGPAPVVQQTINLSTPKSETSAETASEPKASGTQKPSSAKRSSGKRRKERSAPRSGNSLADLLDPETLARLRGE